MMRSWIRKLFTRPATRPARKAPRGFRTVLEVLEDRRVLSSIVVTPIGSGFYYPQGVAVDAAGDVFVADTQRRSRIPSTLQVSHVLIIT